MLGNNTMVLRAMLLCLMTAFGIILIPSKYIPCVHFFLYIIKAFVVSVGNDGMATLFEVSKVVDNKATEEGCAIFKRRLIDDDLRTLCLNTLHYSLN